MAKLHPTHFKGVTDFFHSGKEFYSPVLGEVALETGLVDSIRFFGPYASSLSEGMQRNYVKDTSDDPLWNVVKILFPSINGQLGTITQANTNFARYVTKPQTIAILLNYAHEIRKGEKIELKSFVDQIISTLNIEKKRTKNFNKETLRPLLENIASSIREEIEETSFYPQHTTEQMLLAFFAYHFDNQQDIWTLIEDLDASIVDKSMPLPREADYLTEEDFRSISQKPAFNIDDVFALSQAQLWKSLTPYKEGASLLNNGSSSFYDRTNDMIDLETGQTFAECLENTGRIISNLITFDPLKREFNLDPAREFVRKNSPHNPYFRNFEAFYTFQTPLLASAGDTAMRSLNNKIFADLNAFEDGDPVEYVKKNNEVRSGFINFIRVYNKVLGLNLQDVTKGPLRKKEDWVEKSLSAWFSALNPNYIYEIDLKLEEGGGDLSGDAGITVKSRETNDSLFFFKIMSSRLRNHTEVSTLKTLRPSSTDNVNYLYLLQIHPNSLRPGTSQDSLWLMLFHDSPDKYQHHFHQLFGRPLWDNDSRAFALKTIIDNYNTWDVIKTHFGKVDSIVRNILSSVNWDDTKTLQRISPIILDMWNLREFQSLISHTAQGIHITTMGFEEVSGIIKEFPSLIYLDLSTNDRMSGAITFTEEFTSLKWITLSQNEKLTDVLGLEHLKSLERLILDETLALRELKFEEILPQLKLISLDGSGISKTRGLNNAPCLIELDLANTSNLKKLKFTTVMDALLELFCANSSIRAIEGLDNLPNLETLFLYGTNNLKRIELCESQSKLRDLDLCYSGIHTLRGLEYASSLEVLNLRYTNNLQSVSFPSSLPHLRTLDVSYSGIANIEGLENIPHLESINLESTTDLTDLELSSSQGQLRKLNLRSSGIYTLRGLEYASSLEELQLENTTNLTDLELTSSQGQLKELNLYYSGIHNLGGLEYVTLLESFEFGATEKLQSVSFSSPLSYLRILKGSSSGIKNIEGLENLPGIEKIQLQYTPRLLAFKIPRVLENLRSIDLNNSNVNEVEVMGSLSKLKKLNLENSYNLGVIKFHEPLEKLRVLNLNNCISFHMIFGFQNIINLKKMDLGYTRNEEIAFSKPLKSLKVLNLTYSSFRNIAGLDFLNNLEELNLEGVPNVSPLLFEEDHKNLVIKLKGSGIRSRENIDGFEHLDEKNVHF